MGGGLGVGGWGVGGRWVGEEELLYGKVGGRTGL